MLPKPHIGERLGGFLASAEANFANPFSTEEERLNALRQIDLISSSYRNLRDAEFPGIEDAFMSGYRQVCKDIERDSDPQLHDPPDSEPVGPPMPDGEGPSLG